MPPINFELRLINFLTCLLDTLFIKFVLQFAYYQRSSPPCNQMGSLERISRLFLLINPGFLLLLSIIGTILNGIVIRKFYKLPRVQATRTVNILFLNQAIPGMIKMNCFSTAYFLLIAIKFGTRVFKHPTQKLCSLKCIMDEQIRRCDCVAENFPEGKPCIMIMSNCRQ